MPSTRATFGTTAQQAEATKQLAFNQGFYNLFLAIVTVIGIVIAACGDHRPRRRVDPRRHRIDARRGGGAARVIARQGARAAITQGILPLIAIVLMVVGLAM